MGNPRRERWQGTWPLVSVSLFWLAVLALTLVRILRETGGHFVYSSDDVYIHMAMAKNLVRHGVWGVTPDGFTSSASSLAWPLILALTYVLFGVNEWSPLVLNVLLSFVLLGTTFVILQSRGAGSRRVLVFLLALILFVPLVPLVFNGMEHLLQGVLTLAFAETLWRALGGGKEQSRSGRAVPALLAGLALALTLVRYEGLFLVTVGCLLLAVRRKRALAVGVAAAGLLPPLGWGVFSVAHGWYPLPNSVLIKSAPFSDIIVETPLMTLTRPFRFLSGRDYVLSLVLVVLLLWAGRLRGREAAARSFECFIPGLLFLGVALLHGTFIDIEWFYRHAAYLVALGVWAVEATWGVLGPSEPGRMRPGVTARRLVTAGLGLLLLYPLASRALGALVNTPTASMNIYEMQYQMGLFLQKYYPGQAVAANDIGAIDYLTDLHLVDLYGLASMEVARAKLGPGLTTGLIDRLTREGGVGIAIVYDLWFERIGLPATWTKVAEWGFTDCFVCGADSISFYATRPEDVKLLDQRLREFSSLLPQRVRQTFLLR